MSNVPGGKRGLNKAAVAIMIVILGIPIVVAATFGANKLDSWMPDGEGLDADAWLRTQDVAPGDTVAIRVVGKAGYKTAITSLTAQFGSAHVSVAGSGPTWGGSISSRSNNEDEELFELDIPDDTAQGDSMIQLTVAMVIAVPTGDRTFSNHDAHDVIKLPITIRSPGARTFRRWLDRGIALGAWALCFTAAYWLMRARPRGRAESSEGGDPNVYLFMLLFVIGIALLGMGGQLVFVRSLLRTTAVQGWFATTGLMILWLFAIVAGGWRGGWRRVQDLRWWPVRLRAVVGTKTGSTLPPSISRDADRHTDAELIAALEAAGCSIARIGTKLEITWSSERVMRVRSKKPSPWLPEELQLHVFDTFDPTPVFRRLAELYGPIEYRHLGGETAIVEVTTT